MRIFLPEKRLAGVEIWKVKRTACQNIISGKYDTIRKGDTRTPKYDIKLANQKLKGTREDNRKINRYYSCSKP